MGFRTSFYQVVVAGQDVTSRFQPRLLDLTVTDNIGSTSDTCEIELADPDGSIKMPGKGDPIEVFMGVDDAGAGEVFRGTVDEVRCAISKKRGRVLSISAKGIDTTKKVKEPQQKHKDDANFGDVAQEWGKDAGLQVRVHESLSSIKRAYWDMRGESFIHWGRRIADELGASFKVLGDRAVFVPANDGETASGQEGPSLSVAYGVNLISCSIAPIVGRPSYQEITVRYYDREAGTWKEEKVRTQQQGIEAGSTFKFSDANKDQAKVKAGSESKKSDRKGAEGSVEITGNPAAKAGMRCTVSGVRSGVDGEYRIKTATHKLSKKGGYVTSLQLDQPQGDAGKDGRKPGAGGN